MPENLKRTFYLPGRVPAFTAVVIFICGAAFALHHLTPGSSPEWLGSWGYTDAWKIYSGRYVWGLLTSSWVHFDFLHLVFNLYWVWILGRVLEERFGSLIYLLFWVGAALFSSACELALGEDTGIGASGVVYAIFGYEWVARHYVPSFAETLSGGRIRLFLVWLFLCIVLTWTEIYAIANGAHFGGFVFGCLLGYFVEVKARIQLGLRLASGLVLLALVSAFYAPWSSWWCAAEGLRRYADNSSTALAWFDRIDAKSAIYPYVVTIRASARRTAGDKAGAIDDLENALLEKEGEIDRPSVLNNLAWGYASDNDPKFRNGAKAVTYAKEACKLTEEKNASYLDTLAAACAAMGDYPDAIQWQNKAIELEKKAETPKDVKGMEDRLVLYQKSEPYLEKP